MGSSKNVNEPSGSIQMGISRVPDDKQLFEYEMTSRSTKVLRDEFLWDTFDHPPYSPDLAPSDFHLFLKMKEHLAGKQRADDEDLQHAVMDWLNSQAAVWYEEGISKLVSRYDKCFNVQGD